jgi:hypothetical protein
MAQAILAILLASAMATYSAEARDQDLDMAEWCITRAIEEWGTSPRKAPASRVPGTDMGKTSCRA